MMTQRTFEPHEFEAYAEAGNICRHCDRGKYALHHQTTERDDAPAAAKRGETQHYKACEVAKEIGHSPLPWRVVDFGDKGGSETSVIHIDCHVPRRGGQGMTVAELFYYDSWQNSEVSRSIVEANAKLIVEAVNQHSTLSAQRERLIDLLKQTRAFICEATWTETKPRKREAEGLVAQIDAVITTSEQEGRTER